VGPWIFRIIVAVALVFYLWEARKYSLQAVLLPQIVTGAALLFLLIDSIASWHKEKKSLEQSDTLSKNILAFSFESLKFYSTVFCMILFMIFFPLIGYLPSSILFVFCLSWFLGERRWHVLIFCSVGVPLLFWFGSETLLKVIMPKGILIEAFIK
jgi:hypothetical protein